MPSARTRTDGSSRRRPRAAAPFHASEHSRTRTARASLSRARRAPDRGRQERLLARSGGLRSAGARLLLVVRSGNCSRCDARRSCRKAASSWALDNQSSERQNFSPPRAAAIEPECIGTEESLRRDFALVGTAERFAVCVDRAPRLGGRARTNAASQQDDRVALAGRAPRRVRTVAFFGTARRVTARGQGRGPAASRFGQARALRVSVDASAVSAWSVPPSSSADCV